jgi:hypothetical protein
MKETRTEKSEPDLNSDDFAEGYFKPHGHSELWIEGQIIRIETDGPFNVEAVAAINRTRSRLLEANPPKAAYAYVNTFRLSALMSGAAMAEYEAGLRDAYSGRYKAPTAMAWIFPESIEGGSIMNTHYERIFAAVGIPFKIFGDVGSAESWVRERLAVAMEVPAPSGSNRP